MADHPADFRRDGYVLLRGAIPPPLLARLQDAVAPLLARHREMFPPATADGAGTNAAAATPEHWPANRNTSAQRHQTVLEPAWFAPAFVDFCNLEATNAAAAEIIGVRDPAQLQFAGLGLLLGHVEEHCLGWHRDFGDEHPEAPALWARSGGFLQTNCALFDDPSLWVVRGSHARAATAAELAYEATHGRRGSVSGPLPLAEHEAALSGMPGAARVDLKAGDCLLYNPLIWHAASYVPASERARATFHGGWRHPRLPFELETMRWGVDQNPWFADCGYMGVDLGPYLGGQMRQAQRVMRRFAPEAFAAAAKL
jgi:ectoine hydroxylase-related dioxygenase (phytanoyl-CoA dioxygenase family)